MARDDRRSQRHGGTLGDRGAGDVLSLVVVAVTWRVLSAGAEDNGTTCKVQSITNASNNRWPPNTSASRAPSLPEK
jgi:hypothetical protein